MDFPSAPSNISKYFEKTLFPKIYQLVVVQFISSKKAFTPQFLKIIEHLYTEGEQTQQNLLEQLNSNDLKNAHLDCKKGCSHCCGLIVKVAIPELFLIFEHLMASKKEDELLALMVMLKENIDTKEVQTERSERIKIKCAFLSNNICSIYSVRPFSCRAWNSSKVQSCIEFMTNDEIEIPISPTHYAPFHTILKATTKALQALGINEAKEELNAGILRLLEGEFGTLK